VYFTKYLLLTRRVPHPGSAVLLLAFRTCSHEKISAQKGGLRTGRLDVEQLLNQLAAYYSYDYFPHITVLFIELTPNLMYL
jgi:hypothetical protein